MVWVGLFVSEHNDEQLRAAKESISSVQAVERRISCFDWLYNCLTGRRLEVGVEEYQNRD